MWLDSYPMPY